MSPTPLLLADFHHSGDHEGAWRMPESPIDRLTDPAYYVELAQTVACGGFDGAFFADFIGFDPLVGSVIRWPFEPTTLAAAILTSVVDLNVVVTASTVFSTPDQLYRTFRSLHEISAGRIGWNIVTTGAPQTACAFGGLTVPDHDDRYRVADGIVNDLVHRWGEHRPVLAQAGASPVGRDFAARHADIVFGATPTKAAATAFRKDLRRRAEAAGRDPDSIRFLPGLLTTLGPTEEAAWAIRNRLDALITEDTARHMLAMYGVELPRGAFDDAVGNVAVASDHQGIRSRAAVLDSIAADIGPEASWRQLVSRIAGSRGHLSVTGTGDYVASTINEWLDDDACDGFIVKFARSPSGVTEFVRDVTPWLSAREVGRRTGWRISRGP